MDPRSLYNLYDRIKKTRNRKLVPELLKALQDYIPPGPEWMLKLGEIENKAIYLTDKGIFISSPIIGKTLPFLKTVNMKIDYDNIPAIIIENICSNIELIMHEVVSMLSHWVDTIPDSHPMYNKIKEFVSYIEKK
jgi:hypothetical protein